MLEALLIEHYGLGTRMSVMDLRQHSQLLGLGQTVYERFFELPPSSGAVAQKKFP